MYAFATGLLLMLFSVLANALPQLTIYTYDSFLSNDGPGLIIKNRFEKICECSVHYVTLGDGVAVLNRLIIEGDKSKADILLGIDNNLIAQADQTGLFVPAIIDLDRLKMPLDWKNKTFIPYDYGYLAFIYNQDKVKNVEHTMRDFLSSNHSVIYQDPRTSTPGLGLLFWIEQLYPDKSRQAWQQLSQKTITITKGWSAAYQLFLQGESDYVLSYTLSPAYHQIKEKDFRYKAAIFDEGHYLQVEVAALLKAAPHPALAQQFLSFMLTKDFQEAIPTHNWMYPVIDIELPPEIQALELPKKALLFSPEQINKIKKNALLNWRDALL